MYKEVIRTGIIGAVLAIAATGCGSKVRNRYSTRLKPLSTTGITRNRSC